MAVTAINKHVRGKVIIGDLTPDYFRTFPNISVKFSDVSIKDSLMHKHQRGFLQAEKIHVQLQLLSLVSGKHKVGKVIVKNGNIHLYTDECQYCNLQLTDSKNAGNADAYLPKVRIRNTQVISENHFANSYHDVYFHQLNFKARYRDNVAELHFDLKALVHGIGFNMDKGSYLKEKSIEGDFSVLLTKDQLDIEN